MATVKDINNTEINLLELIKENIEYENINNHYLGSVIEISPKDAFEMSSIIGCSYLINPVGFSMKGRNETFIHRTIFQDNAYIYSPGLFERDKDMRVVSSKGTFWLKDVFPDIFKKKIKLIFKTLKKGESSNIEEEVYKEILCNKEDPSNYMLMKLHNTAAFEPILEYLAFKSFNKRFYLFENQVPFFQQNFNYKNKRVSGGIPDICFIRHPCLNELFTANLIPSNENITINSLPFLTNYPFEINSNNLKNNIDDYEIIIGEAKSSSSSSKQAITQMEKYSYVDLASDIFSFIPDYENDENSLFSSMFIDKYNIKYKKRFNGTINKDFKNEDMEFMETTIKMNLLAGIEFKIINEEICQFHNRPSSKGFDSAQLVNFCLCNPTNKILKIFNK